MDASSIKYSAIKHLIIGLFLMTIGAVSTSLMIFAFSLGFDFRENILVWVIFLLGGPGIAAIATSALLKALHRRPLLTITDDGIDLRRYRLFGVSRPTVLTWPDLRSIRHRRMVKSGSSLRFAAQSGFAQTTNANLLTKSADGIIAEIAARARLAGYEMDRTDRSGLLADTTEWTLRRRQ